MKRIKPRVLLVFLLTIYLSGDLFAQSIAPLPSTAIGLSLASNPIKWITSESLQLPEPEKVEAEVAITRFILVDASTNQDIGEIQNGDVINLATLSTEQLNIRAETSPSEVGHVNFYLRGTETRNRTDASAPYAAFGNSGENYNPWIPTLGDYTLNATAYEGSPGNGQGGGSYGINFTVIQNNELALASPGDVVGFALSPNFILLSWSLVDGAESYEVQSSLDPNTGYETQAIVAGFLNQFSSGIFEPSTTYYFRVRSLGNGQNSEFSEPIAVTTLTPSNPIVVVPPSNIFALSVSSSIVNLFWTQAEFADQYEVQQSTSIDGNYLTIARLGQERNSLTVYGLLPSRAYYYRLRTRYNGIYSDYSEPVLVYTVAQNPLTNFLPKVKGELKTWHPFDISFRGPETSETDEDNPFMNYRLNVEFKKGDKVYTVPGYYAADGNASETGANEGNVWRVHFTPDGEGIWEFTASFRYGTNIAVSDNPDEGQGVYFNGIRGRVSIRESDKEGRDFRAKGRLQYVGERYLQFAGTGEYFLKAGADAPETLLAYEDFDGTYNHNGIDNLKNYDAHEQDWETGDPSWNGGKGKGLIGALNYLAGKGNNSISFLTYNAGGDGKNVWPFTAHDEKLRYDCSKLDQWNEVFNHADAMGMYLHFKTQETENDNNNVWALDNGNVGPERKLYYRELIARFSQHLGLNWNLGEENSQSNTQRVEMIQYFADHDPYRHNVVLHTFPFGRESAYTPLLGDQSELTGASLQVDFDEVHAVTLDWINQSQESGKPWVVANDEQGPFQYGVPPDLGWPGYDPSKGPSQDQIRKLTLWGNLMAGGAGVEYYFGYLHPEGDVVAQNWRSRDQMWDYNAIALDFFQSYLPFWEMNSRDDLLSISDAYCLAKPGEIYAAYLQNGGNQLLNFQSFSGTYTRLWYNPRTGEAFPTSDVNFSNGFQFLGSPPQETSQDWVVLLVKTNPNNVSTTTPFEEPKTLVYPNPARDYTQVEVSLEQSSDVYIDIYQKGKLQLSQAFKQTLPGKNTLKVDTYSLEPGQYQYIIRYHKRRESGHLVIVK